MTRLRCILIVLLSLFLVPAKAQVLYEISGNGAKAKSYLLATNRYTEMTFLDTIPNVFKCFGRCRKVVTEFAMQDYEAIAALRQAAILPDSIRLANFYSESEYKLIDDNLRIRLGMGLEQLCRMKPSYLTELFRAELMRQWLGYDDAKSMDSFFESVAAERNIPVVGLDDIGETMFMLFDRETCILDPLVYVPALDSMFWEKTCASGTAAIGACFAPADLKIKEPGGVLGISSRENYLLLENQVTLYPGPAC